jgi:hypothetical protein
LLKKLIRRKSSDLNLKQLNLGKSRRFSATTVLNIYNSDYFDVRLPELNMGATESVKALQVSPQ